MFLLPIMVTMYKIMSSFSPLYTEDIMVYMRVISPIRKKCAEVRKRFPLAERNCQKRDFIVSRLWHFLGIF